MNLLLSCEHYSNALPASYEVFFKEHQTILYSHRGYDPGAANLFDNLKSLATFHIHYPWTRLLIEPNRSLHHPNLFSEITMLLPASERKALITNFYRPYRESIFQQVNKMIGPEPMIHLSIHSFTRILHREIRNGDIGILYDPSVGKEKEAAKQLAGLIRCQLPHLKLRKNYPYRGKADGLTTALRQSFNSEYIGIEIEVCNDIIATTHIGIYNAVKQLLQGS
jgi:predicted N-formylglutamate amidohydrolase